MAMDKTPFNCSTLGKTQRTLVDLFQTQLHIYLVLLQYTHRDSFIHNIQPHVKVACVERGRCKSQARFRLYLVEAKTIRFERKN